jgi:hypothetical protein
MVEGSDKPGKKNKLKVGQKVRALPQLVDWFASHLTWSYGKKASGKDGYGEGEREIRVEDLPQVYVWIHSKLSKKMPIGIVSHFGNSDYSQKSGKPLAGRKCVWIDFKFKTELGEATYGTYVSERDLVLVKKK